MIPAHLSILIVCCALLIHLLLRKRRTGPRIVFSQLTTVAFAYPRTGIHWSVLLLWLFFTMGFIKNFIQPLVDAEIRQEYLQFPGGLVTAWLLLFLVYFPFQLGYLWRILLS